MAKSGAARPPVMAIIRGEFHPNFGILGNIWAYSPQEVKRADFLGFPVWAGIEMRESGPL